MKGTSIMKNNGTIFSRKILLFLIFILLLVIAGCSSNSSNDADTENKEKVTIYKSFSCGCCGIYTQYMDKEGYDQEVVDVQDISLIKAKYNIPSNMQSCHTTVIGNYFVEGHVPVEAIEKLLSEKPDIAGIAMPGMPSGSPGMAGAKTGPFVIYAVHADGSTEEFMRM